MQGFARNRLKHSRQKYVFAVVCMCVLVAGQDTNSVHVRAPGRARGCQATGVAWPLGINFLLNKRPQTPSRKARGQGGGGPVPGEGGARAGGRDGEKL